MGGAVSTGQDNNDLIDNLLEASYIKTPMVERVFRAVDRGEYFLTESRGNAYKDLAWKSGHLHISAPCIYSKVMEGLELKPGLSFLNLGSGTGYLSTMVGLILGNSGINHGIELHRSVIQYANKKLADFKKLSGAMDEYDFCEPQYIQGNCLCLINNGHMLYDRVYCGAACPAEYATCMKKLLHVGGILVMPLNDKLLQIKRVSLNSWEQESLLPVSFATLILPTPDLPTCLESFEVEPQSLQALCRTVIRNILRKNIETEHCPIKRTITSSNKAPKKKRAVKKIVVPLFDTDTSDDENRANADRDRSRSTNRVSMRPIDNDQLLNLVLGTLHGTRREFLRSYRRSNKQNTDSNTSSSEVNKTDESEPMEVEFEADDARTEETGDNSKAAEQTKQDDPKEGTSKTNHTHKDMKKETKECPETTPITGEDAEMIDDSNNKNNSLNRPSGSQNDDAKNTMSTSNNERRDNIQNTDEGESFLSVIHMPSSLVIDGVVITNIQTFNDVDEAMNELDRSDSNGTESNNDSKNTTDNSETKENTSTTQGSGDSDNQKCTTTAEVNNTEKTTHKKSIGDNDSDGELLCDCCCENQAAGSSKTTNKSKDNNSRRKKFDSGLGDEIIESNMGDTSSEEESDNDLKIFVKDSSDSEGEDGESKKEDNDNADDDGKRKRGTRQLRWTRIELNRRNSASGNSSDNDKEDSKTDSEEYRMYQSPFTVHMRNKIQKLPLPVMLKHFLNYNRDF